MSNAEKTQTAGELAVQSKSSAAVIPMRPRISAEFDPETLDSADSLPSLEGMKTHPAPLSVNYWSPTEAGTFKDVFVFGVGMAEIQDMESKQPKMAECVFLVEKIDGEILRWYSASVALVGDIKAAVERGEIVMPGPGVENPSGVRVIYGGTRLMPNKHHMSLWKILKLVN